MIFHFIKTQISSGENTLYTRGFLRTELYRMSLKMEGRRKKIIRLPAQGD